MIACKTETKETKIESKTISEEKKELTIPEKIAQAHGFDNWANINQIEFTFNVDRGENHFERAWMWQPKNNYVVSKISKDSITMYTRSENLQPNFIKVDQGFVNDKFWLFVPYQLVWDDGTTFSEPVKEAAPISKEEMNKITLTYSNDVGYTPGDAYDIFYNEDFLIKEWVFRKGNSKEPSMVTTFENYKDFMGVKIATEHKTADGSFNLYFSNITVK